MQTLNRPLTPEETESFLLVHNPPPKPSSRLRGRIMAAGYRYKLLEESQGDCPNASNGPSRCNPCVLLIALIISCFLFATMLTLFIIVVLSGLGQGDNTADCNSTKVCLSPGCIQTSADILAKIDDSIDPCTDMYHYACGKWIKEATMPPGHSKTNQFSAASLKNDEFLRKILEEETTDFKGHNSTSMAKLKQAYRTCMDKSTLDKIGISRFVELINRLGSWTVVNGVSDIKVWKADQWELQEHIEATHNIWGSGLFTYGLAVDDKNTEKYILSFSQAGVSLPYPKLYSNNESETFKNGFLDYATQVAVLLGGDEHTARAKMEEVYNLEKEISKMFVPRSEMTDPMERYHKMSLKDLQTLMGPWINLKQYLQMTFNGHEFADTEEVLVRTPSYFTNLSSLVEETDKEVMANYLMWHTLPGFFGYLPDAFMQARFPLIKLETGVTELPIRWKLCASHARSLLGYVASAVYVDAKFSASDKAKALEKVEVIRQEFISNLKSVTWLDDVTRERLRDKAEAIVFNIGYPDWIIDPEKLDDYYDKMTVHEGKLFENRLSAIEFSTFKTIQKYGKKPDKTEWATFPITVNGFYSAIDNTVTMPAGILQPPFFSSYFPEPFLYSTIGMVVGHELTHAFDNSGRMYDKMGNLGNMWTPEAARMYRSHAECIEDEYGEFSLQGVHLNGKTTLNENIADNGALRLAYSAYRKDEHTSSWELPGVNLTDSQLFFLGYAQIMCAKYTPQYEIDAIATDEHSYPEFRIKGVYDNMPEFTEAFNCPQQPNKKSCRVW